MLSHTAKRFLILVDIFFVVSGSNCYWTKMVVCFSKFQVHVLYIDWPTVICQMISVVNKHEKVPILAIKYYYDHIYHINICYYCFHTNIELHTVFVYWRTVLSTNNYRPNALVTAASKLFEICILELVEIYLVTHDQQFGF